MAIALFEIFTQLYVHHYVYFSCVIKRMVFKYILFIYVIPKKFYQNNTLYQTFNEHFKGIQFIENIKNNKSINVFKKL